MLKETRHRRSAGAAVGLLDLRGCLDTKFASSCIRDFPAEYCNSETIYFFPLGIVANLK